MLSSFSVLAAVLLDVVMWGASFWLAFKLVWRFTALYSLGT
jgi:hypothetical protein